MNKKNNKNWMKTESSTKKIQQINVDGKKCDKKRNFEMRLLLLFGC